MLEIMVSLSFMAFTSIMILIIGLTLYTIVVSIYPPLGDYVHEKIAQVVKSIKKIVS